jgi:hypothetical protein
MYVARRKGAVTALLAVVVLTGGTAGAAGSANASLGQLAPALRQSGASLRAWRAALPQRNLPRGPVAAAPLSAALDNVPTATSTPVVLFSPVPTNTPIPIVTTAPPATGTATPATGVVTPSATVATTPTATIAPPTATPSPSPSPSPRPPTRTPRPTAAPPTATPRAPGVKLIAVQAATLANNREQRVTTAPLGATLRLRIVVVVSGLASGVRARVSATWALRGVLTYSRGYALANGETALYDDVVLPTRGLATGAYYFTGTVSYQGAVQQATTTLHVVGEFATQTARRVHYAHLRLTVPQGWQLDFQQDSSGRAATGQNSLIMFSPTKRTIISVISAGLRANPTSAELHAFPQLVLQQEFDKVTNAKPLTFKSQIDGHDVFAAVADVTLQPGDTRTSQALALVTNKSRQIYVFTVVDLFNTAPETEITSGLASILGVKLD